MQTYAEKLARIRLYQAENPEKIKAQRRKYWIKNRVRLIAKNREWRRRGGEKKRRATAEFKIELALRTRLRRALKGKLKRSKAYDLLGCDLEYFREYLEVQFHDGMTWKNYGSFWQIDHIIPCAKFDFAYPGAKEKCFHYTNLQPLTTQENLHKSASVPPEIMHSLDPMFCKPKPCKWLAAFDPVD